jgi:phage FluMu protein Com
MIWIDVRCQHCDKLLCKVSKDFQGLVQVKCQNSHCRLLNTVSLAIILRQMSPESAIINFPRTSAR